MNGKSSGSSRAGYKADDAGEVSYPVILPKGATPARMIVYVIQGLGLGLAAAAQPGPYQAYLIGQSLERGWRPTLPAALAPLISDGPIVALVLLVLHRVPAALEHVLYIAGGVFILYLAWQAFATWRHFDPERLPDDGRDRVSLLRAALMNALSPGPYIYWSLVTGPILLAAWRETHANGLGFLVGFYVALVGTSGAIIVLSAMAKRLGPQINRALLAVSALALLGFGLRQLWTGLSSWLT